MSLGYGVDTWCGASRITGRLSRGRTTLALALYRRLITPRGTLKGGEEASVYGFDIAGFVGRVGYDAALGALPSMIAAELRKDDRVADVLVEVSKAIDTAGNITLTVVVHVVPQDESNDFTLTIGVSATEATLQSALPEAA